MLTIKQKQKIREFRRYLLRWGKRNRRSFPWRKKSRLYEVLVAEFFLQRTNAEQVARQYDFFVWKYKNFAAVNRAKRRDLERILLPLGLRKRTLLLKKLASVITKEYGGRMPTEYEQLVLLPGIGDYTANALLLFVLGQRRPLVDANTIRVFSNLLNKRISREEGERSKLIRECAKYFSSLGRNPRTANWTLLDYGAAGRNGVLNAP